jgi:hypothetical protein
MGFLRVRQGDLFILESLITLGEIVDRSIYGSVGTLKNAGDLDILSTYVSINRSFLSRFRDLVFSLNGQQDLIDKVEKTLSPLLPNSKIHIVVTENLGHTFGTFLSDSAIFDYVKPLDYDYVWKLSNDVLVEESIFNKQVSANKDFYYINNIGYGAFADYNQNELCQAILNTKYCYPQTNFYIIKKAINFIPSRDEIYDLKNKYDQIYQQNPGIQPWHAIQGCDCEHMIKETVHKNNLSMEYLLSEDSTKKIINWIHTNQIHDGSHKNIAYSELGNLCHMHFLNAQKHTI